MLIHQFEILMTSGRRDGEGTDAVAVEEQFQFMRFAQAFDLLIAIARQANLDFVLRVLGKGVGNQGAAAGTERKAFDVFLLGNVWANADSVAARAMGSTDCEAADVLGGGDRSVEESGR